MTTLVINKEGWEEDSVPTIEKEIPIEDARRITTTETGGLVVVTECGEVLIFDSTKAHFYYATFK